MTPDVKFAAGMHRRPSVTDLRPREVRVRVRGFDRPDEEHDDLRAARGLGTSVMLGLGAWILILLLVGFIWF
jgi:hypothetical protein